MGPWVGGVVDDAFTTCTFGPTRATVRYSGGSSGGGLLGLSLFLVRGASPGGKAAVSVPIVGAFGGGAFNGGEGLKRVACDMVGGGEIGQGIGTASVEALDRAFAIEVAWLPK